MHHATSDSVMISVVIPLYNKEKSISASLSSVLEQKCSVPFEIVIVDDGSTDGSAEIVLELASKHKNIHYVKQENAGPAAARNKGIEQSHGEWIMFLDADDLLLPNALETLYKTATQGSDISFACGNFYVISKDGTKYKPFPRIKTAVSSKPLVPFAFRKVYPIAGAYIIKRKCIPTLFFDPQYRRYEDFDCFLSFFRTNPTIGITSEMIYVHQNKFSEASTNFDPSRDFACHMDFKDKSLCEKILLAGVLWSSVRFYPQLRKQYNQELFYCFVASTIDFYDRIVRRIS